MPQRPLESLGELVRKRRGPLKLREAAAQIGIGPATLLRVESGRIPDIPTFGKLCDWLEIDPRVFLGTTERSKLKKRDQPTDSTFSVSAHLKADQNPKPETIKALAQMLTLAHNVLSGEPDS